ncbi:hypothetical protein C2G38_2203862 [Gigaspora rosea]|uniref:Uncharacterized protein n=1 Tax=Gigaspora rosea TaxID=44941 RepID=A0A397UR61_9GLOM|nr:hypothetical protein C2G38_2203862 [Gigaspora rosea]
MPENCHNLSKPINFKKKLKTLMINEPENPIERQRVLIDKINDLKDLADANLRWFDQSSRISSIVRGFISRQMFRHNETTLRQTSLALLS